ncbi:MAG TPA: alpha/beta hydrolase-fold protein [Chloroflexota bacterium]|jgi:pimeloyl-ACP methyl ester carboxylesterase
MSDHSENFRQLVRLLTAPLVRLLSVVVLIVVGPIAFASGVSADAPASFDPGGVYVYTPPGLSARAEPVQVVVALHGMGGEGRGFCQSFLAAADRNGWVVVAPTFKYRNWKEPAIVAEDDVALTRQLAQYLDRLPDQIGHRTTEGAVVLGFSRGAQLAHRFALLYPEHTRAVAAMSAGTYTLPTDRQTAGEDLGSLPFPFGTADLGTRLGRRVELDRISSVDFWIAVGADDNRAEDVPRQWDALLGKTRLQRAESFAQAIKNTGAPTELVVYQDLGHNMSAEMVRGATGFVERITGLRLRERSFGGPGLFAY